MGITSLKKRNRIQWLILLMGMVGTAAYFLHVIVGRMNYPGYDSVVQAVSDLTADSAPSREIAGAFSYVYGVCAFTLCILLCVFYQDKVNRWFRLGIYLMAAMQTASSMGYTLFPLSESGYAGTFQDIMHMVVTVLVVLLSVAAMILIAVGCFRRREYRGFGVVTLLALGCMFGGSIGMGALPDYLGIAERFSVYSVVLYGGALSGLAFCRS